MSVHLTKRWLNATIRSLSNSWNNFATNQKSDGIGNKLFMDKNPSSSSSAGHQTFSKSSLIPALIPLPLPKDPSFVIELAVKHVPTTFPPSQSLAPTQICPIPSPPPKTAKPLIWRINWSLSNFFKLFDVLQQFSNMSQVGVGAFSPI